jgi:hypothetical protein
VNHKQVYRRCREDGLSLRLKRSLNLTSALPVRVRQPAAVTADEMCSVVFVSDALDQRAYENGATLVFSRPCTTTGDAFAGSFSGRLRDER